MHDYPCFCFSDLSRAKKAFMVGSRVEICDSSDSCARDSVDSRVCCLPPSRVCRSLAALWGSSAQWNVSAPG